MAPTSCPGIVKEIDDILQKDYGHTERSDARNNAYCCLLYGSKPSDELVAEALVMGLSMQNSRYPLVLLHTPDVPVSVLSVLQKSGLFKQFRIVEYIRAHLSLFKKDWFRDVFTKLHIFALTEFHKVIFLDLDTVCMHVSELDQLFDTPNCVFGAFENSKRDRTPIRHGQALSRYPNTCKLINAGLILVSPNKASFECLLKDVVSFSVDHVPGMTPEQFYLARVMGHHFVNFSQKYNFEVQYHGGVPAYSDWRTLPFEEIVMFHFSGAQMFERLVTVNESADWGCQVEKYFVRKTWESEFSSSERDFANARAEKAFREWSTFFLRTVSMLRSTPPSDIYEAISELRRLLNPVVRPTRPPPSLAE